MFYVIDLLYIRYNIKILHIIKNNLHHLYQIMRVLDICFMILKILNL
jgi:hypothetical protein